MDRPVPAPAGTWLATFRKGGAERLEVSAGPGSTHSIAHDGRCIALFDGVLHSRRQWLQELSVTSASDASLVLEAYLRWGEAMLERVKGLFALIVWDGGKDLLLCARDPHGLHPCFYADDAGDLLLSASSQALATAPGCVGHGRQACNRRPPVPSVAEARVDVLRGRAAPAGWLRPPRPRRKAQRRPLLGPDSSRKTDRLHLGRRGRPLRRTARPGGRPVSPGRPGRGLPERRARLGQRRSPGTGAAPRPRGGPAARAVPRVRAPRCE